MLISFYILNIITGLPYQSIQIVFTFIWILVTACNPSWKLFLLTFYSIKSLTEHSYLLCISSACQTLWGSSYEVYTILFSYPLFDECYLIQYVQLGGCVIELCWWTSLNELAKRILWNNIPLGCVTFSLFMFTSDWSVFHVIYKLASVIVVGLWDGNLIKFVQTFVPIYVLLLNRLANVFELTNETNTCVKLVIKR